MQIFHFSSHRMRLQPCQLGSLMLYFGWGSLPGLHQEQLVLTPPQDGPGMTLKLKTTEIKNLFLLTCFLIILWNSKNKCTFATSYSNSNFSLFATLFQCDSYFHQEWENLALVMVVMTLLERKHTFSSLSNDELIFLLYPLLQ